MVKARDYDAGGEFQAVTPYALWSSMKAQGTDLSPGDVLEVVRENEPVTELHIFKYIGFEPAKWWIPEPKPEPKTKFDRLDTPLAAASDWSSI